MNRAEVSLQDILNAIGGPLEERALWALLYRSCSLLKQEQKNNGGKNMNLLVTPETMTLYHGGNLQFPRGMLDASSDFLAPEVKLKQILSQDQQEKSYVYSLGMTLFTAMQHGLDSTQAPQVSENLNRVLVSMVEEDDAQRAQLSQIHTLTRKFTNIADARIEVDRLVSYIMGPEDDLESENDDPDHLADDANLESELNEVMNLHPTGSVEQLYSPSYGSRGSSLSIHSAAGNLQLNASFKSHDSNFVDTQQLHYSSMPMVYFTSQDRLNKHTRRSSSSDNDSWSSFDRLVPHLQTNEIEALANKTRGHHPLPPHRRYSPHFYTPTRSRKRGYRDVNRSASFEHGSLGIYRTASDEHGQKPVFNETLEMKVERRKQNKREIPSHSTPEKRSHNQPGIINSFSLDDMPPLPPTTVSADISMDSPMKNNQEGNPQEVKSTVKKINTILQSIDGINPDEQGPPPIPPRESSLHTPVKNEEEKQPISPQTPLTNSSFDYSELGSPPQTPHSVQDDIEFSFSSAPPIPATSPPPDEETGSGDKPVTDTAIQPLQTAPPLVEGWKEGGEISIDRNITPRRALDEAFKQLDKIGESGLDGSDEEPLLTKSELNTDKEIDTIEVSDDMYAKVDMKKKREDRANKDTRKESDEDEEGPPITPYRAVLETTETAQGAINQDRANLPCEEVTFGKPPSKPQPYGLKDPGYEDIEFDKPLSQPPAPMLKDPGYEDVEFGNREDPKPPTKGPASTAEEPGYARVEDIMKRPISGDYSKGRTVEENVHKASSEANVIGINTAVVHAPQRSSMPPAVLLNASPLTKVNTTLPMPTEKGLKPGDDVDRKKSSLKKLQAMFGPEFTKLSGGAKISRSDSSMQVAEGRRLVRVTLLTGKSVQFVVNCESKCQELFQQVVAHQSLQEKRIFGLAVLRDNDEIFLDLERKLSKYAPDGWLSTPVPTPGSNSTKPPVFSVFFRVQYYVENALIDLKLQETRHQLYRQLRRDTVEGKMYCHEESALKLGAYALQAEKGDYKLANKNTPYFRLEEFVPEKMLDKWGVTKTKKKLEAAHVKLSGKSQEEAELSFLREAQTLPEYGIVFYQASKSKSGHHGEIWLGFSVRGIVVFDVHKDVRTPLLRSAWNTTENISFANRKFIIQPQGEAPQTFYTQSYKRARYLLHLSISYHRFQFVSRPHVKSDSIPNTAPKVPLPPNPGYDALVKCYPQLIEALSREPRTLAKALQEKGLISRELLERIHSLKNASTKDNAQKLQLSVLRAVESDPNKYADLVSVLNYDYLLYGDLLTALRNAHKADSSVPPGESEGEGDIQGDKIHEVRILKEQGKGLGIRITSEPEMGSHRSSVVIQSLEKDGPAYMDGRLRKGDILVSAEGHSLEGLDHKEVGDILKNSTSQLVRLSVRRKMKDVAAPLSPPVASTESVVVEIGDDSFQSTTSSVASGNQSLKRITTLETLSTHMAPRSLLGSPLTTPTSVEILNIIINRGDTQNSFGFAIAAGYFEGIVILKVTTDGAADRAGLKKGDRLLSVNGSDSENYDQALSAIQQSGSTVTLGVSRRVPCSNDSLPPGTGFSVELMKQRGSLGLRLAGGRDKPNGLGFIYVKMVVNGSIAEKQKIEPHDILLMINSEDVRGKTHGEAATVIASSGNKVNLRLHRPFDRLWLEPSCKEYLKTNRGGIVREESSTAIYMDSRPLSQAGAPLDLSFIQEDSESQIVHTAVHVDHEAGTSIPPLKGSAIRLDFSEPIDEATPPEPPKEGPPLEDNETPSQRASWRLSIPPAEDLLSSISEPYLLTEQETDEGVTQVKSEVLLTETFEDKGRIVVSLKKGFRGLGFGLDRDLSEQPGRGVFVKSVDYDPAKRDGRIQPGDEITQVNDESLINLPHRKVLNIFRLAQGTVTLMIRRDSDEETDDLPPLPPDSPLPPESFRHYSTAEDINSFPIIDSLEEQETKPPNSLTSPLTSDSSGHRGVAEQEIVLEERPDFHPPYCRALEETGSPVVPSSLPPQENNSSLQMKTPTPPESPLPLDNDETEPPPAPSASLLPQEDTTSLEIEHPVIPKETVPQGGAVHVQGEIVISLRKGFKGLGFSLNKELSGQDGRGIFVRSVVGDPAKSDGRIQPRDEIIKVNEDSLINLSHKEAVNVFRLAQGTVTLVIRREDQTPPILRESPMHREQKNSTLLEEQPLDIPTEETGPLLFPSSLPPQESNSSLQMEPPTPPESPLPLDNDETEPPLAPSASLLPQESTISLEMEQPVTPKNPLQLDSMAPIEPVPSATLLWQGSTTSIETEPPIPPLSPLPHESTTSLDVTDQTLDISTASYLNSIPPADDDNLSDIDRLSMSPSDDEILSTKYSL